ncbi:hypothetical protein C8R47DRAFT_181560 [Mycena vitilis]|nr:hypothetical protein C8R47DRAFT_181560 [Mycena vitilis]
MEPAERNAYNDRVGKYNSKSIEVTRAYEAVIKAGGTPATSADVGPSLRAPYGYTSDEMELMVEIETFCQAASPIPASLIRIIVVMRLDRFKEAERKKEREKVAKESGMDLLGKLVMSNPIRADPLTRPDATIPPMFLQALGARLHPSLFWLTDARLRFAEEHPAELFTKKIAAVNNKVFMDVPKLKTIWGSGDSPVGYNTILWKGAMKNYIAAYKLLCPASTDGAPTFYSQLVLHRDFVLSLDDFEDYFTVCFRVEKEMRLKITDNQHLSTSIFGAPSLAARLTRTRRLWR